MFTYSLLENGPVSLERGLGRNRRKHKWGSREHWLKKNEHLAREVPGQDSRLFTGSATGQSQARKKNLLVLFPSEPMRLPRPPSLLPPLLPPPPRPPPSKPINGPPS